MIMLLNIKNYVDFRAFAKSLAGFMRSALAICAKTETEMFLSPLSIVCRYLLCKSQISENCSIVKFWPFRSFLISKANARRSFLFGLYEVIAFIYGHYNIHCVTIDKQPIVSLIKGGCV